MISQKSPIFSYICFFFLFPPTEFGRNFEQKNSDFEIDEAETDRKEEITQSLIQINSEIEQLKSQLMSK